MKTPKVGRPLSGSGRVLVTMTPAMISALDNWRGGRVDKPSRPEAIRQLLVSTFEKKARNNG
ncbi:hypothetical protein [Methylosinus sp. PW1]|uniref:hypothetical protein n=1 Tax=Methylosinus sp. PW1 TaxID=107636 RepID=UPI0018DBD7CF|nr:hypothetical protein [Methylosinus sp. PW1]